MRIRNSPTLVLILCIAGGLGIGLAAAKFLRIPSPSITASRRTPVQFTGSETSTTEVLEEGFKPAPDSPGNRGVVSSGVDGIVLESRGSELSAPEREALEKIGLAAPGESQLSSRPQSAGLPILLPGGAPLATATVKSTPGFAPSVQGASADTRPLPSQGETPKPPAKPSETTDPSSDSTPPSLVSIRFEPPAVRDGEEASIVIVAADDLSGLSQVSGILQSPNGKAVLGFGGTPGAEEFRGKVIIPKDAEEGLWQVTYVHMADKAHNTSQVRYAAGNVPASATLAVRSSNPDSTPPVLKSIAMEKRSVAEGEKNKVIVEATDDRSGVNAIYGSFVSPAKTARIGFSAIMNVSKGYWEGELVLPKSADCGDWSLEQIQLIDKASNRISFGLNEPLVRKVTFYLSFGGNCDSSAPVLLSIGLAPLAVSNSEDSEITVTAKVTDEGTGVASLSGRLDGPRTAANSGLPPMIYFNCVSSGKDREALWFGTVKVPKHSAKGVWTIGWLQVSDKANNSKQYSATDPVVAAERFVVQ